MLAAGTTKFRYIKGAVPGYRRGTAIEVDHFLKHYRKGCYTDPLPPEEMSFPLDTKKGELSNLHRLRGTSGGESCNRRQNDVGHNIVRMGSDLANAKLLLCMVDWNNKKDELVQHITGKAPRSRFWYLEEKQHDLFQGIKESFGNAQRQTTYDFPPKSLDEEPLGDLFMLYDAWGEVDGNISVPPQSPGLPVVPGIYQHNTGTPSSTTSGPPLPECDDDTPRPTAGSPTVLPTTVDTPKTATHRRSVAACTPAHSPVSTSNKRSPQTSVGFSSGVTTWNR